VRSFKLAPELEVGSDWLLDTTVDGLFTTEYKQ